MKWILLDGDLELPEKVGNLLDPQNVNVNGENETKIFN